MDNFNGELDDIIDLTDTESSSSSNPGIFEVHQPFVLELHNIRKDDPMPPDNVLAAKIKKHKKKKKSQLARDRESRSSVSTDSISEASSVTPSATDAKEEFYDAHESYHAIPANQTPVIATARLQGPTENNQNPKAVGPPIVAASEQTTTSAARKEPSTISKPTVPPE